MLLPTARYYALDTFKCSRELSKPGVRFPFSKFLALSEAVERTIV
jgi:hypothetical protein